LKLEHVEIETKWNLGNEIEKTRVQQLLKQFGGVKKGSRHEINRIFDNINHEFELNNNILRLRFIENETKAFLTFKGKPNIIQNLKHRSELELAIEDGSTMEIILGILGYCKVTEYSKNRETWNISNTEVVIDELPFGLYCEIEGKPTDIKNISNLLGLKDDQIESRDYAYLSRTLSKISGDLTP